MGDPCDRLDFDYLSVAGGLSQVASLMAGMILGAIAIVVSQQKGNQRPAAALMMLSLSELVLIVCAIMFAASAGEKHCIISYTQGGLALSGTVVGMSTTMAAVSWLVADYGHSTGTLRFVANLTTGFQTVGATIITWVFFIRYNNSLVDLGLRPGPQLSFAWAFGAAGLLTVINLATLGIWPGARMNKVATHWFVSIFFVHLVMIAFGWAATITMPRNEIEPYFSDWLYVWDAICYLGLPFLEYAFVVAALPWNVSSQSRAQQFRAAMPFLRRLWPDDADSQPPNAATCPGKSAHRRDAGMRT